MNLKRQQREDGIKARIYEAQLIRRLVHKLRTKALDEGYAHSSSVLFAQDALRDIDKRIATLQNTRQRQEES